MDATKLLNRMLRHPKVRRVRRLRKTRALTQAVHSRKYP